jgi:hypothetical protein
MSYQSMSISTILQSNESQQKSSDNQKQTGKGINHQFIEAFDIIHFI